jgi:hypothetical protein
MPTNLGNAPLDGLKIGQTEVLRAYVGIDQIFPNATAISAAAFDNATVTNTAQNTNYTVQGEVGSSFTLTGATGATGPTGTQVLGSTSATYPIAIGDNSACAAAGRSPQIIIAPQGNTVLVGGLSNTDTIAQAAGPSVTPYSINGTTSVSYTGGASGKQLVGSTWFWVAGASWDITYNITSSGIPYNVLDANGPALYSQALTPSTYGVYTITNASGPSGVTSVNFNSSLKNAYWTWGSALPIPLGSYTYTCTLASGSHTYVQFGLVAVPDPSACITIGGSSSDTYVAQSPYSSVAPNG